MFLYLVILINVEIKYTDNKQQLLQDRDMIPLLENNIRGGISSVMCDRYVMWDENKKILYIDANNLYGPSISQPLPFEENKFDRNVWLEDIIKTLDDSDIGYFVKVDLKYPDGFKEKTKNFLICREKKIVLKKNFLKIWLISNLKITFEIKR